ncbi:MAG: carbamoyltransferase, partial [Methylocystis sp.]|nr:carbamoyltransferase [Methylocystis sp.]
MLVIGLNAYHADAAACILRDGVVVAAAEEERFRRIKHWSGFPSEAIRYCLQAAGASLSDVNIVAINGDPSANIWKRGLYALTRRPSAGFVLDRLDNQRRRLSIEDEFARAFPASKFNGVIRRIEHHRAHMASAFFLSPFRRAVALSLDGFGDFASAAWGVGDGNDLRLDAQIYFPHSLGVFYQAITQYLGFPNYGDEYKIMGLAPYGAPTRMSEMRQIVRLKDDGRFELDLAYFRHHREKIDYVWSGGAPSVGALYSNALIELLGPPRNIDEPIGERCVDIAHSAQQMYEEAFFHLLDGLYAQGGEKRLALAGGCAMNSVANGKIRRRSRFREIYVAAAPGDAGGALGAALEAVRTRPEFERQPMTAAYLGPSATPDEIDALLFARRDELACGGCVVEEQTDESALCRRVAATIAEGKVVGWFQGRMEWG